ncbi:hypothetical protein QTO34_016712, partial [Cnephaeus nilssonii]
MGSQSSKAPGGDVTPEEAAGASPAKANGQENGPVKSNGHLHPKVAISFKRTRKEGGGESSASSPTEEEQERGEMGACSEEGTAQEGKAVAAPESQEPQAKGAEASAASKGGHTEEEAGPQAAELSTPSGPESGPTPASEQNEKPGWDRSLPGPGALAAFLCPERKGLLPPPSHVPFPPFPPEDSPLIHLVFLFRPVEDGPLQFP